MHGSNLGEASFDSSKTIPLLLSPFGTKATSDNLMCGFENTFAGIVLHDVAKLPPSVRGKTIYICGDVSQVHQYTEKLAEAARVFIVRQGSYFPDDFKLPYPVVDNSRLPAFVHGVGVMYPQFFSEASESLFHRITSAHILQNLTEGNKPGTAYRTGAYLSSVQEKDDGVHFDLLRCSSNLSGPTLGFQESDRDIIDALNLEAGCIFDNAADLNHVLAQVYHNKPATSVRKQSKAKIKAHSDKTKDMPQNGIIAFCTFYDNLKGLERGMEHDPYDYGYRSPSGAAKASALTTMNFKLKACVASRPSCRWTPEFSVTLYPGSVFFMPLSTNRLYTHEIRPSVLDADKIPTRLGYVVRCSNTPALHSEGQTYLVGAKHRLIPLQPPDAKGVKTLRGIYRTENISDKVVDYGTFLFSLNNGDYQRPITYGPTTDTFRRVILPSAANTVFQELRDSVVLEVAGKDRLGAVLVRPDPERGTPIVRTTSSYRLPAQVLKPVHEHLVQQIRQATGIPESQLNNGLVEVYGDDYTKMAFHSDQALDLQELSHIAIFSCYKSPDLANPPPRILVIESKDPSQRSLNSEIPLAHNSVVVFSTEVNQKFKHKIVLAPNATRIGNEWLGVTFRTSKTFVQYSSEGGVAMEDGTELTLGNTKQIQEFYKLRGKENRSTGGFSYPPELTYTVSESDLMPPTG